MLDSGNSYDGRRNAQGLLSMLNAVVKWKICSGEGYLTYFGKTFETFYIPVQLDSGVCTTYVAVKLLTTIK